MKSICFFCSYFNNETIPSYVKIYLNELKKHFSQIVLLTNEKQLRTDDLNYLSEMSIQLRNYKNEGFDFGMWYKAFMEFPVLSYDRIGLVNDSCILFKELDFLFNWIEKNTCDYCGMTDSNAIAYHIQSYFVIIKANAIKYVYDYFKTHRVKNDINKVIHQYEVGLCTFLLENKMKLGACFKHSNKCGEHNPMLFYSDKFIKEGLPLIKKKIIFSSFRKEEYRSLMLMNFNIDPRHHINLIKEVNGHRMIFHFDNIANNIYPKHAWSRVVSYKIKSIFIRNLHKLRRFRTFNKINAAIRKYMHPGL
jgi:lipopolysaccharide biosynthesis protein